MRAIKYSARFSEFGFALLAGGLLLFCLFYTFAGAYLAPYPGFELGPGWVVTAIDACEGHEAWCEANQDSIRRNDEVLQIEGNPYADYLADRRLVPFDGFAGGEEVHLLVRRDGREQEVLWQMLGPTTPTLMRRVWQSVVLYVPFWLAGTLVLLFLRPRDRRWRLLIAFNYVIAAWLAVGAQSQLLVAYSSLLQHAAAWLLMPVFLHLHLVVQRRLHTWVRRRPMALLYGLSLLLAACELLQLLPGPAFYIGLLVAILGGFSLLLWQFRSAPSASERLVARLMLAGIALAFGPSLLLTLPSLLFGAPLPPGAAFNVAAFSMPLLPFFYTYAIYKHRLGTLEFRANRLLGDYTFVLLYATVLLVLFTGVRQWITVLDFGWVIWFLGSLVLVASAPAVRRRVQRGVDYLAYGAAADPEMVIHFFADRFPLDHNTLFRLLAEQVMPTLLIRQSALYMLHEQTGTLIYAQGVEQLDETVGIERFESLMSSAGMCRQPEPEVAGEPWEWVRLPILLTVRNEVVGIWLFGQRDPDDYYPRHDIHLLNALASQVAVASENARLYQETNAQIAELRAMQAQLVQAAKLASLGTLLAGLAHELNNPLAGIKTYAQNVERFQRKGRLTPEVLSENMASIDRLVEKSARIIEHFRSFSRQSSGSFALLDISAPVNDALSMLREQLRLRDISVTVEMASDLPPVMGDSTQLEQVVLNLVVNARDALTERDDPRELLLRGYTRGEDVVIEVSDTGCGIAEEHLGAIFDPFFTTKEVGEGTGLGLSISYGIVRAHMGRLEVESTVGVGTTFRVVLPAGEMATEEESDLLQLAA